MSLLDLLEDDELWVAFAERKRSKAHLPEKIIKNYETYVAERKYADLAHRISSGEYEFSIPVKKLISKGRTGRKRAVYMFDRDETMIFRMLTYLLYEYDHLFAPNLYSFRRNGGVKKAIADVTGTQNIECKYGYKTDISNYFNSIDPDILIDKLRECIPDKKLNSLFRKLLKDDRVIYNGEIIREQKGIMAGVPISAFLANLYLMEMDRHFLDKNITYARYADDVIVFADTPEELTSCRRTIMEFLEINKLTVNPEKEITYSPGARFEFLGFSYHNGTIDLSENTFIKIKAKIRRSARSIRRWMIRKNVPYEKALYVMNRKYNLKFFGKNEDDLTWKYWFFTTINTDRTLKEIDRYMQESQRYIVTGKHNKKNFEKVPYDILKQCGYRSLVSEYYSDRDIRS